MIKKKFSKYINSEKRNFFFLSVCNLVLKDLFFCYLVLARSFKALFFLNISSISDKYVMKNKV